MPACPVAERVERDHLRLQVPPEMRMQQARHPALRLEGAQAPERDMRQATLPQMRDISSAR